MSATPESRALARELLPYAGAMPVSVPLTLDRAAADPDKLEVMVSIASDAIVDDAWLGPVMLSMDPQSVNLDTARERGIPVLEMHERDLPVGRVFRPRIEDGRLIGTLRFSRTERGQKLYLDCVDGIITDTSVGAIITAVREEPSHLVAIRWTPREVSLVDTGADQSVGINRKADDAATTDLQEAVRELTRAVKESFVQPAETANQPQQEKTMTELNQAAESVQGSAHVAIGVDRSAENTKAIMGLAEYINTRHPEMNVMRLAEDFSQFDRPFDDFRKAAWDMLRKHQELNPKSAAPTPEIGLSEKEQKQFSIVRAALAQLTGDWKKAGFELECSRAISENLGRAPRGFYVPSEVQRSMGSMSLQRTQSVGDPTLGGFIVSQDYRGDLFVEALRAQSVAMMAGVRTMPGLQGNVTIPVQTGSASFGWIAEGVDGTASNLTFSAINMAPRTVAGAVPMTRRLLMQSSPAIEQLVRQDLVTGAALALDDAILEGNGHSGVPLGISNHPAINTSTITSAGNPDWDEMVAFESEVAADNALGGRLGFITTPAVRGVLKTKSKDTGSGLFVMEGNEVNGYPLMVSTQLATHAILFGDWSQIMVGFWGVLDIKADESTLAASGGLVLRAFQDVDVAIRHGVAFCKNT